MPAVGAAMWPSACSPCSHPHTALMCAIGGSAGSHQETSDHSYYEDHSVGREWWTPSSQTKLRRLRQQQQRIDQTGPFVEVVWHAAASPGRKAHCQRTWKPWRHPVTCRSVGRMSLFSGFDRTAQSYGPCHCHTRMVFLGSALRLEASLVGRAQGRSLGSVEAAQV